MRNVLLCSVGHSSMVVPEAYRAAPVSFDEVHVFTTDSPKFNRLVLESYFGTIRGLVFSITQTKGLPEIVNKEDYTIFQELQWRWYLEHCNEDDLPWVCLSGGIKSMSASFQKAATLFGAKSVFHVIADKNPQTISEMEIELVERRIHFIDMGPEPGWEQLRKLHHLFSTGQQNFNFRNFDPVISNIIKEIMGDVGRKASGFSKASKLPFPSLALLPPVALEWLKKPLADSDHDWVKSLPKVDLHCHLGGFATFGELLNLVRNAADNPPASGFRAVPEMPADWPIPHETVSLDKYMHLGDANGSALLKDRGSLIKQIELIYNALCEDRVAYAEIRCSPNNYAERENNRSAWDVLIDIRNTFSLLIESSLRENRFACRVNLIVIASRKSSGDLSDISRHLSLAITAMQQSDSVCRIVGVDLAGFENRDTRASYFEHDFRAVHRCGLAVTAHAGENDDPEGIWQAVYTLHARRLGHALNLAEAPDLLRTVTERKIGVEMCPYANFQIKGFFPMPGIKSLYPLKKYLDLGVVVTVNTDNIGISQASLTDNFMLLSKMNSSITRLEVIKIIRNGLEMAFISHESREKLLEYFDSQIYSSCVSAQ